jgi:hypothetical protein
MPTQYIAQVFASGRLAPTATPSRVYDAIGKVVRTATFHGGAWQYPGEDAAIGVLCSFDVGLASPYAGSGGSTAPRLLRAMRRGLRSVIGKSASLDVRLLDADRADWFSSSDD